MNSRKSQSIVDFVVAFIAIAVLIVGITRIWIWFNANYAKRQAAFQASRIVAAGRNRPYDAKSAAVSVAGTVSNPGSTFEPYNLTEDWVFKGKSK